MESVLPSAKKSKSLRRKAIVEKDKYVIDSLLKTIVKRVENSV